MSSKTIGYIHVLTNAGRLTFSMAHMIALAPEKKIKSKYNCGEKHNRPWQVLRQGKPDWSI